MFFKPILRKYAKLQIIIIIIIMIIIIIIIMIVIIIITELQNNKVAGLKTWNFTKKRLQHRCFPVKFAKFLRTTFFTEHLRWLLLEMERHFIVFPFFITMI